MNNFPRIDAITDELELVLEPRIEYLREQLRYNEERACSLESERAKLTREMMRDE